MTIFYSYVGLPEGKYSHLSLIWFFWLFGYIATPTNRHSSEDDSWSLFAPCVVRKCLGYLSLDQLISGPPCTSLDCNLRKRSGDNSPGGWIAWVILQIGNPPRAQDHEIPQWFSNMFSVSKRDPQFFIKPHENSWNQRGALGQPTIQLNYHSEQQRNWLKHVKTSCKVAPPQLCSL